MSGLPSLTFLLALAVLAALAPWITTVDPSTTNLAQALRPPTLFSSGAQFFPFGTDHLGRDVFSRVAYGSRISLLVGSVTALIAGSLGVALGLISGYFGRGIDSTLMRVADVQISIPLILLVIIVLTVVGFGLWKLIFVLGVTGWVIFARTARSQTLTLRSTPFVEAARAVGASDARVLWHHILPNIIHMALVLATFTVPQMILTEAALSFLGLGVQPPTPTWGNMVADGQRFLLVGVWWMSFFPGVLLFGTVISINLLGDSLRDYLDPRSEIRT